MVRLKNIISVVSMVLIMIGCNPLGDKVVLNAPENIKIERTDLETVCLTWTNTSTSYDGVVVERSDMSTGYNYVELGRAGTGVLIYNDRNHKADAVYSYRLTTYRGTQISESAVVNYRYSKLPAPSEFKYELTDEGLVLTWKDNCVGEDGYVVRRMTDGIAFSDWKTLEADATTVTDDKVVSGLYEYEIYAFAGSDRSAVVNLKFDNTGVPQIKAINPAGSWHQVCVPFTLVDDGGYPCEVGICWKDDGSRGATVNDNCYTFPAKLRTGDIYYGSATGLVPGKKYSLRPWVKYDGQYHYYSEVTGEMLPEPEAYSVNWNNVSNKYGMPKSIRLYSAATNATGRNVKAWYAVADMSAGDLEFRTCLAPSPVKPSEYAAGLGDVKIIINGGYFDGSKSESYIMDRGNELASGILSLKGTYYTDADMAQTTRTYHVTRGAFGVDQNQQPSVKWLYGSNEWAYETPLQNFVGGPMLKPSATTPSTKHIWKVQSAIGGGPIILHDDHVCFDYLSIKDKGNATRRVGNPELLGDDVFGPSVRTARTAIGHTADGKIVLMIVECDEASEGVTLDELARLMKSAGCSDALNLDGSASVMCAGAKPLTASEPDALSFVAIVSK